MKKHLSIVLLQMFIFSSPSFAQINKPIDVMSFNIRYDNPEDGKQNWHHRKCLFFDKGNNNRLEVGKDFPKLYNFR